jgi:hypothetical protein
VWHLSVFRRVVFVYPLNNCYPISSRITTIVAACSADRCALPGIYT